MPNKPSSSKGVVSGNKRKASPPRGPTSKIRKDGPVTIVQRVTPIKSPNDPNSYRVIQLSNGLTAALISRKEPNQGDDISVGSRPSAPHPHLGKGLNLPAGTCSLFHESHLNHREYLNMPLSCGGCTGNELELNGDANSTIQHTSICLVVNVGSLDDPEDCQGLSHFTEHMVHYGSKKFPGENEICVVVANFGTFNAFTAPHSTSYYNQVPDTLLEKDLELFSEMLTNPSFEASFLKKEVEAVDNEFYLRLPVFRKYLLLPHVAIREEGHPLTRFACGNLETLTDCQDDAGMQMKAVMADHFENHYVASAMSLTINSTKSLDELEALTLKHFSTVLQGEHTILHMNEEKAVGQKLPLQNTKDAYTYFQGDTARGELALIWMLPASLWIDGKNEKVTQLLKGMLSDTSPSSLDTHLREQGWIQRMRVDTVETLYCTLLDVTIFLTEAGRTKTDNIIQDAFAFITALRNSSQCDMGRFFEEIKISNQREYYFGSQYQSIDDTVDCAMRLQRNGRLETLVCEESWKDAVFNHERMMKVLDQMLSRNSLVIIETIPNTETLDALAKAHSARIQQAPYSGIPFLIVPKKLKLNSNTSGVGNGFGLPAVNPLLKEEYEKSRNDGGAGDAPNGCTLRHPQKCGKISGQNLPYKSGMDPPGDNHIPKITGVHRGHSSDSYDKFRGSVKIQFISQFTFARTAQTTALGYLWAVVLDAKIHSSLAKYNLAGYRIDINVGAIQVYGFPKHLEKIVRSVLKTMLEEDITPRDFALAKEQFGHVWEMMMTHQNMLTQSIVNSMTQPTPPTDLWGTVKELTLDELNNSIQAFRSCAFCYVTLQGNVPVRTFSAIAAALDDQQFGPSLDTNLTCSPLSLKYTLTKPGLCTPGEKCIRVIELTSPSFTTSVTNAYILGPYNTGDDRTDYFETAMDFMNCQAMLHLRTEKQLGYVISARQHLDERMRVPVMMFTVQVIATAEKFTACELDQKIDEFLSLYGDYLTNMDDDIFNTMKSLKERPDNLTKEQVGNWFNSKFGKDFGVEVPKQFNPFGKCVMKGIRKLSVQVITGNANAHTKACGCEKCSNINWVPGSCYNSQLAFAQGKGEMQDYFVQSAS